MTIAAQRIAAFTLYGKGVRLAAPAGRPLRTASQLTAAWRDAAAFLFALETRLDDFIEAALAAAVKTLAPVLAPCVVAGAVVAVAQAIRARCE